MRNEIIFHADEIAITKVSEISDYYGNRQIRTTVFDVNSGDFTVKRNGGYFFKTSTDNFVPCLSNKGIPCDIRFL